VEGRVSSYDKPEGQDNASPGTSAEVSFPLRRMDPDAAVWSSDTREIQIPEPADIQFFDLSWPSYWISDCKLGGNNLRVFSDGRAEWRASMMSLGGDDSWGAIFEFFDIHGLSLWAFGRIWSPSLSPPGAVIDWVSTNQLFFHAHLWPQIATASLRGHC